MPGVMVESVGQNSESATAGPLEGDVIQTWSQKEINGTISSPFDLISIEAEYAPRGPVTLASGYARFGSQGLDSGTKYLGS